MKKPAALALAAAAAMYALDARAAGFAPGEEMVLSVRYLNLPTGEGRIVVGQPEGDIWPIIFQAKTQGIAGFIDIREHLVSYWDATTKLTRGSDLKALEIGDFHADSSRFDRANGQVTVVVQRKDRRTVKTVSVPADAHELTSAFMWLRLQPLAVGQRYELPVISGTKQFTLIAEVIGRESVDTDLRTFPALKVKIRTALEGKFSTKRDSYMWLSDDPAHIIVRAEADFAVGSIVATLKSYKPGGTVAAR